MAAKAHLRNGRPLVLAISTNDGLSGSAENIARLLNRKNVYFVPFGQDDPAKKRCVGFLIGALVYLQLLVLLISYLHAPAAVTRGALLGGAAMLVALRFLKRCLPKVSAS